MSVLLSTLHLHSPRSTLVVKSKPTKHQHNKPQKQQNTDHATQNTTSKHRTPPTPLSTLHSPFIRVFLVYPLATLLRTVDSLSAPDSYPRFPILTSSLFTLHSSLFTLHSSLSLFTLHSSSLRSLLSILSGKFVYEVQERRTLKHKSKNLEAVHLQEPFQELW